MALEINELRSKAEGGRWVNKSGQRIAVTKDGRLVSDTDPAAIRLLVSATGTLPKDVAAEYGLVGEPEPVVEPESEIPGTVEERPEDADEGEEEPKERSTANKGRKAVEDKSE